MSKKNNDADIKRMASLLQQGATLTDLSCPSCSSPLFRLKDGSLWCGKDEKKVIIVKEGHESPKPESNAPMDSLENTLLNKVHSLQEKIENSENIDEIQKLTTALSELLESIEKIKRIKKS